MLRSQYEAGVRSARRARNPNKSVGRVTHGGLPAETGGSITGDADTLDGHQGAEYAQKALDETITGRWTYTTSLTLEQNHDGLFLHGYVADWPPGEGQASTEFKLQALGNVVFLTPGSNHEADPNWTLQLGSTGLRCTLALVGDLKPDVTDGSQIGLSSTAKLGLWGATPCAQQAVGATLPAFNPGDPDNLENTYDAVRALQIALKTNGAVKT